SYYLPQSHNLALHAEYIYTCFTDTDHFDDFFSNHALYFNAEIPFRFSRAQQISLGAEINISIAGIPEQPRRDEFGVYIAYSVSLTGALSLTAAGRVTVRDYVPADGCDVSDQFALTAKHRVMNWLNARV